VKRPRILLEPAHVIWPLKTYLRSYARQKTRRLKQFLDINMLLARMLMSDILACKAEAVTNEAVATASLTAEDQSPPRPPSPNNNEIPLSIFEVVERTTGESRRS
jgi:hypothetical protein